MDALAYALMPLLEVDSIPDTLNKTKFTKEEGKCEFLQDQSKNY